MKPPGRAGTYKIPTVNDIPLDLRVTLLRDAPCARTPLVHSSKAVGEPPLFLGASVFFALKAWPPSGCQRVNAGTVRRTTFFLLYCQQHQFSSCEAIYTSVCVLKPFRPTSQSWHGSDSARMRRRRCMRRVQRPICWAGSTWMRPPRLSACAWRALTS